MDEAIRPKTGLDEYRELLAKQDWHYERSEDHQVWLKGRAAMGTLLKIAQQLDPDRVIWVQYDPRR